MSNANITEANCHDGLMEKIADILKDNASIPGLQSFTCKPDDVAIEEDSLLGVGDINGVVRLRAMDGSSVIVKHFPLHMKGYDRSAISQARGELEMTALHLFEQHSPDSVPKPLVYSSKHNIILMEDLVGYTTLHSELLAGNVSKAAIGNIAEHMARIHGSTHKDNIGTQEWAKLQEFNKYLDMVEKAATKYASYSYIEKPQDAVAKELQEIAQTRVLGDARLAGLIDHYFKDAIHRKECLIHSDPNTKNILVKGDDAKFIDLEFTHLGPCSLDLAMLLGNIIIAYYYHLVSPEQDEHRRLVAGKLQDAGHHLVHTYIESMTWGGDERADYIAKLMTKTAMIAGFVVFNSICTGHQIPLGASQVQLIEASIRLMEQHQGVDSVEKIYSILALGGTD